MGIWGDSPYPPPEGSHPSGLPAERYVTEPTLSVSALSAVSAVNHPASACSIARRTAEALWSVSWYSESGLLS